MGGVAMLGAMVASRRDEHIRIDIASRFVPEDIQLYIRRLVSLFTATILSIFAWYSIDFVRFEYEDGTLAFGVVPAWMCEVIMPFGAAVMAFRYFVLTLFPQRGVNP